MSKNSIASRFEKSLEDEDLKKMPDEGNNHQKNNPGNQKGKGGENQKDEHQDKHGDNAKSSTLRKNLPEAEENDNKLSQLRSNFNKSTPVYVDEIDKRIAVLEEELSALRKEKSIIMSLSESIKVF